MNLVNILAAIIGAGVLERYPNVRVAFGESGIGWIPYALDRMDFEWEDRFHDLGLTMKPSDYWRRQCRATFQFDRIGAGLVDEMGLESLMWGIRLPPWRRGMAGIEPVHRGAVRPPLGTRGASADLRQRARVLPPSRPGGRVRPPGGGRLSAPAPPQARAGDAGSAVSRADSGPRPGGPRAGEAGG